MSKELEALNTIKGKLHRLGYGFGINQELSIIETALKDYEMEHTLRIRLENINYELVEEKESNEKKLKALQIIKNKCSPLLKQYLLDLLPKEENELLKEVLK